MSVSAKPLLHIRSGLSRNPLHWLRPDPALALVLAVATPFNVMLFGYAKFRWDSLFTWFMGPGMWLVIAVMLATRVARVRQRLQTEILFYPSEFSFTSKGVSTMQHSGQWPYESVRHVSLSKDGYIRIARGLNDRAQRESIGIDLGRNRAPDAFDFLVSHIESAYPKHLFSVDEQGDLRYSLPWDWGVLASGYPEVREATFTPARAIAGRLECEVIYRGGYCLIDPDNDDQAAVLRASTKAITHGSGMVLAEVERRDPDQLLLSSGEGGEMTVHLGTGAVVSDGRQIARIEDSGSTVTAGEVSLTPTICSIQCEQALPALQCLAVLAVFADCRMHDSMKGDFGGAGSDAVLDRPVVGR